MEFSTIKLIVWTVTPLRAVEDYVSGWDAELIQPSSAQSW